MHTTQRKYSDTCCHFALDSDRYFEYKFLNRLNSASFHDRLLVLLRACSKVPQRRDCMALDFFVILEGQKID